MQRRLTERNIKNINNFTSLNNNNNNNNRIRCDISYYVKKNILHTTKGRKANWIGQILRKNCLLKHVIEGKKGG
jgi:hypothetical protein